MNLLNKSFFALFSLVLLGALSAPAFGAGQKYTLDPTHTQVYISWNHFGFSNPGAAFHISEGTLIWNAEDPSQSSVTVTIPVATVDTQVPELDKKLKSEFFEAEEYPTITFESASVERIGQSRHYRVTGDLTVHGITRPVTLRATLNKIGKHPMRKAPAIGFDATATIKRSNFGVGALTPMVSDLVHIRITAEGVAAKASAEEMAKLEAEPKQSD